MNANFIFILKIDKYKLTGRASLIAQLVKNLPTMQETWVRSLCQNDPPGKDWRLTTVFSPGKFYGQRSLAGYSLVHRVAKSQTQLSD